MGFGGGLGAAEHLGDLAIGKANDMAQHHRHALLVGERQQRPASRPAWSWRSAWSSGDSREVGGSGDGDVSDLSDVEAGRREAVRTWLRHRLRQMVTNHGRSCSSSIRAGE